MAKRLSTACALLVVLFHAGAALAVTEVSGQTPGGAFYRIAVPDAWNGMLVIWNHGYDFSQPDAEVDLGPLADLQLAEGYAVAASSYRLSQWAVFRTDRDLEELVGAFRERFPEPQSLIVTGASLGGIVTASALERAKLGNVVGAYPLCGAVAGSRVWDGALDIRLSYDAVCGDVPGAAIPGGATDKPSRPFPITVEQIALAADACTGILALSPASRTPAQQARLDKLLSNVQIPESFLITDLAFSVIGLDDLTFDQGKLGGKLGVGNVGVAYDDPEIDAAIRRVRAHPVGARRLQDNFTPRGDVGDVRIVSLHTDKDGLVIVENEKEYDDVVDDDQLTIATVVEAAPSHCDFNPAEVIAGWESLRGWLAGLPQPSSAGIQFACQVIEGAGLAPGPCRIDPGFVVPDMDGRVKPRSNTPPHERGRP